MVETTKTTSSISKYIQLTKPTIIVLVAITGVWRRWRQKNVCGSG